MLSRDWRLWNSWIRSAVGGLTGRMWTVPPSAERDVRLPPIGVGDLARGMPRRLPTGEDRARMNSGHRRRGKKATVTAVENQPTTTRDHHRTCPLCEATCGLEITVERATRSCRIRGDRDDVVQPRLHLPEGLDARAAPRGSRSAPRARSIRRGDDPATHLGRGHVGRGVRRDRAAACCRSSSEHGRDAVGVYLGNPNAHTLAGMLYVRPLLQALGTPQPVLGRARSTRCRSTCRAG